MIRPSRRISGRLGAVLLVGLLFLVIGGGEIRPAAAAADCPTPADGDLLQASDGSLSVFTSGVLRAVPDRKTLRALGFDPNGADPIRDECLRTMRFGDPFPSVGTGDQRGASATTPLPAATRDPAVPAIVLDVSDVLPAHRSAVRLTARTDAASGTGLLLSIHRTSDDGRTGTSGLVTTCADATVCSVEVWEDEATTWDFVATLYRCSAPGVCVAVQESSPVRVAWQ